MHEEEPIEVYYDGACPVCSAAASSWRRDSLRAGLALHPLEGELPDDAPSRDRLRTEIHVRHAGRWLKGASALYEVYRRLPRGRPMALLLRVGLALGIADPLYRFVARHRMHVPLPRRRG